MQFLQLVHTNNIYLFTFFPQKKSKIGLITKKWYYMLRWLRLTSVDKR